MILLVLVRLHFLFMIVWLKMGTHSSGVEGKLLRGVKHAWDLQSIVQCLEQEPIAVIDRIITMRLPLKKNAYATIISVYALTMTNPEEINEGFYSTLRDIVKAILITDKLIITGGSNARVGREVENWPVSLTQMGLGCATQMARCFLHYVLSFNLSSLTLPLSTIHII